MDIIKPFQVPRMTESIFIIVRFASPGDILAVFDLDPRRTNCQRADRGGTESLACIQNVSS